MIRSVQRSGALLFALMLTGCVVKQQTPAPVEPTQPTTPTQPEQPPAQPVPPPQTVPQPPKLKTINWNASVQP